jgi:hypothetical protein
MAASRGTPLGGVQINRAPVLTLWAAVVAERLGHDRKAALTLGRAVAGLNAADKAKTLGIARDREEGERRRAPGRTVAVPILGREVKAVRTPNGLRAVSGGNPAEPASVQHYLEKAFGDTLSEARAAMTALAKSLPKDELAGAAYGLYEDFRPAIPKGVKGWGAKGVLSFERIRALGERRS